MGSESVFDSLVFDLDGTISDPKVGIVRSLNHGFRPTGSRNWMKKNSLNI
jgi:phosphoglycolate phosphatase-like HAD superfamily hydrolase